MMMTHHFKKELVSPYLHEMDSNALINAINAYINDNSNNKKFVQLITKYKKTEILSPDDIFNQIRQIWRSFPRSIVNDIYNIYYNHIENLKFEQRTEQNGSKYRLLDKANDPNIKVITNNNSIRSMIFTRGLVQYYLIMLSTIEQYDNDSFHEIMKDLKDKSGSAGLEELNDLLEEQNSWNKIISNTIDKDSKENIEELSKIYTENELQEMWEELKITTVPSNVINKMNLQSLKLLGYELKKVTMSLGSLQSSIKKILNKSISYFSSKEEVIYNNLLESDNLDGLEDYHLLHPNLKKLFINDILVKDVKKVGKVDLYLDVSGSMDAWSGSYNKEGKSITKIHFAKAFVFKMKELNLINDLYVFDTVVDKTGKSIHDILSIESGGGTNINEVVKHISKINRNAIVLTDAEDHCSLYSKYTYFIGVKGANFSRFANGVKKQYVENKQIIIFDGIKVENVVK